MFTAKLFLHAILAGSHLRLTCGRRSLLRECKRPFATGLSLLTVAFLFFVLFDCCSSASIVRADDNRLFAEKDRPAVAGSTSEAASATTQVRGAWSDVCEEFQGFEFELGSVPDFLRSDPGFLERSPVHFDSIPIRVLRSGEARSFPIRLVSGHDDARKSQTRRSGTAGAQSNLTFLQAGKSESTSVGSQTDPPIPTTNSQSSSAAPGNLTVIPGQMATGQDGTLQTGANPSTAAPQSSRTDATNQSNQSPGAPLPAGSSAVNQTASQAPSGDLTPPEMQAADVPAPAVTLDSINAQKTAADAIPDLSEETRGQLAKYFQRATESLIQKAEIDKKYSDQKAEKENGPALIADAKALLSQPPPSSQPEYPPDATVTELDQLRLADEERAAEARRNLEAWELKAKTRAERKPQMPALIEATRQQVEEAEKALSAAAPDGELPILGAARRLQQQTQVMLLRSQLELYRVEQIRYEALNELFPLQRDLLTRIKNSADKRVELWKTILGNARREESVRQAQEAREKLQNAHPTLRDLAENNSDLTIRRRELQEFLRRKTAILTEANSTLTSVEQKLRNVTEKEQRAGLTTAIGLLLRSQRAHLPDARYYRQQQHEAEQEIVRLQTEQMPLEDERSDLFDIESEVAASMTLVPPDERENEQLREMTRELLTDRKQYLDDLLADYDSCLQTLGETDVTCRRLEATIHDYESYIDERVLWIRSSPPIDTGSMGRILDAFNALVENRQWSSILLFLVRDSKAMWPLYGLLSLQFIVILGFTRRIRRRISELGERAERQLDSGIPLTLLATALTILMASGVPFLLLFVGWRLRTANLDLATALGSAMMYGGVSLWIVDSFRKLCRKHGVAESFLGWPQSIVQSLRSSLFLYLAGGIPLTSFVTLISNRGEGIGADSLGRLAFFSFSLLLAIMLRRIVSPTGAVIGDFLRSNPGALMYRLRWVWYPLALGAPLFLAVLSLMGYQYTAEQLMVRFQLTIVLSIVLVIAYTMLMQWMLAAKRSLAIKQARARRAAALAAAQREVSEDGAVAAAPAVPDPPQVDLTVLNQQVVRMVQGMAGLLFLTIGWTIWGQVFPALQLFSRIELWSVVVESTTAATGSDGSGVQVMTRVEPVTLGHLLMSVVLFSAAILASRNLPGLLELVILQRLPLDHGGRNAITTLCRYALVVAGGLITCNVLGIHWRSVQWLVAALTVGLGFGLQEIFANFVSGLIILFERPVRIGDVVTIDGVSGVVSRIQIRATTITDWDRKEYIVPNREFVTGKLLNWTLSDKVNRIVINVGVAYGTDTEKALKMLLSVAEDHPLILKEPAATVGFEGFGESSLNMVLRCFLATLDQRLAVTTQLHLSIDKLFREAGIEIAFPQRDLHIRTFPAAMMPATEDVRQK